MLSRIVDVAENVRVRAALTEFIATIRALLGPNEGVEHERPIVLPTTVPESR